MSDASAKRGNPHFSVRLRQELQDEIRGAAEREGMGIAQWLERALRPALRGGAAAHASGDAGDLWETVEALSRQLGEAVQRIEALESHRKAAGAVKSEKGTDDGAGGAEATQRASSGRGEARRYPDAWRERARELRATGLSFVKVAETMAAEGMPVTRGWVDKVTR